MKTLLPLLRNSFACLSLFLFSCSALFAQTTVGKFSVGGSGNDVGFSVIGTEDGGLALTGFQWTYDVYHQERAYIIKLNASGTLDWSKTYGEAAKNYEGDAVVQTRDGGFVVAGGGSILGSVISKFNAAGDVLWMKSVTIGICQAMTATKEGGFALTGFSINSPKKVWVVNLDSMGTILWSSNIGGDNEEGNSISQTDEGGFIITGFTQSFGIWSDTTNYNVYAVKLDPSGNIEWTRAIGGRGSEIGKDVIQTTDGGYAIVAASSSFGGGCYIIKLDSSGNLSWTRTIDTNTPGSIRETSDGGLIVCGTGKNYGDIYFLKLNTLKEIEWCKTYSHIGTPRGFIAQSKDGGYAVTGQTSFIGIGAPYDIMLLKVDANGDGCDVPVTGAQIINIDSGRVATGGVKSGITSSGTLSLTPEVYGSVTSSSTCLLTSVNDVTGVKGSSIYPNPFSAYCVIDAGKDVKNAVLTLYDITGRQVLSVGNINSRTTTLNRNNLPAGLYVWKLQDKNGYSINGKVVAE